MGNPLFIADSSEELQDENPLTPNNTQDQVPRTATPEGARCQQLTYYLETPKVENLTFGWE
jgi:hypothetical protein